MADATEKIQENRPAVTTDSQASPPAMTHFSKAQSTFKPPLIANENAYLGDIASSDKIDPDKPISAGFYRLEKGTPLVYTYTYHEMKIIVEGEFDIADETGQKSRSQRKVMDWLFTLDKGRRAVHELKAQSEDDIESP
ncbi:MAG: hypothetical protein M1836_004696 [Candelina mexicana]|nr:MAG: hypothetical protein M1836_004696 [Candelina mexicana]